MKFNCPICGKVVSKGGDGQEKKTLDQYFPFCSERCRLIDLGAWLDADYRIGSHDEDTGEEPGF